MQTPRRSLCETTRPVPSLYGVSLCTAYLGRWDADAPSGPLYMRRPGSGFMGDPEIRVRPVAWASGPN